MNVKNHEQSKYHPMWLVKKNTIQTFLSLNKIVFLSIILLLLSFLVGLPVGYLFFGILFLIGLLKPEFLLVALFSVGTFKNLDIFQHFPVDLTIFIFGITIYITLLIVFLKSKINKIRLTGVLVLLQGLLMFFSAGFISGAEDLKWWNVGHFLVFNLPLFFLPFLIIHYESYKTQIKNIILGIYSISLMLLGAAFHNFYFGKLTSWSLTAFGESYITLSLYISFGIIFLLYCLFYEKSKLSKFFYFILLIFFIAGLILSPSMGIFFSLIAVLILLSLKIFIDQRKNFKKNIFLFLLMLIIIIFGFFIFQKAKIMSFGVERIIPTLGRLESSQRIKFFCDAIEDFIKNPLIGKGVGMFSYEHGGKGTYPHNIFLEVAAEYGLIGIVIFGPFLVYLLYLALKFVKIIPFNDIFLLIPIWFLIIFLDAMVSGSIVDSRSIWFFGAVILIISRNIKRKESTIKNYKLL